MPAIDATAAAQLATGFVAPAYFAFLDFVGGVVRATTYGTDVVLAATGDSELDGTYDSVNPKLIEISEVANQVGGSDPITISLSGIVGIDTAVLAIVGDKTKWYRRTVRLWMRVHDEAGAQQGAIVPFCTGYMTDVRIVPQPKSQTIQIQAVNYLTMLREASRRTYLDQANYDSGDLSAAATIAAVNGAKTGPAATVGFAGGIGGGMREVARMASV